MKKLILALAAAAALSPFAALAATTHFATYDLCQQYPKVYAADGTLLNVTCARA